jgi:Holliday junction resolvasome RuvABC ATP-dependent DNA helicase subunit
MVRAAPGELRLGVELLERVFADRGIDEIGLGPTQRRYLYTLAGTPDERCSITRLAHALGLGQRVLRGMIEPLLFRLALIEQKTNNHRSLTARGREVVLSLPEENTGEEETVPAEEVVNP